MPWLKVGDDAATFPALMSVMGHDGADERLLNEVAGFLFRLAILSGAHMTDYLVDAGTCFMVGGSRTQELIKHCVQAGLLAKSEAFSGKAVCIIENADFLHIRLKKDVEADRQRKRDNRDPRLTVPVRKRDGDQCRYCGHVVQWRGRTSNRTATFDHRVPGQPATVDTLVVACVSCNSSRQDNPQWDDDNPLLTPPAEPLYSKVTVSFLADNGVIVQQNIGVEPARKKSVSVEPPGEQPEWSRAVDPRPSERGGQSVEPRANDHGALMDPDCPPLEGSGGREPGAGGASRLEPLSVEPRAADHSAQEPESVEPTEAPASASVEPAHQARKVGKKYRRKIDNKSFHCPPKMNFVGSGRECLGSSQEGTGRLGTEGRSRPKRRKRRG